VLLLQWLLQLPCSIGTRPRVCPWVCPWVCPGCAPGCAHGPHLEGLWCTLGTSFRAKPEARHTDPPPASPRTGAVRQPERGGLLARVGGCYPRPSGFAGGQRDQGPAEGCIVGPHSHSAGGRWHLDLRRGPRSRRGSLSRAHPPPPVGPTPLAASTTTSSKMILDSTRSREPRSTPGPATWQASGPHGAGRAPPCSCPCPCPCSCPECCCCCCCCCGGGAGGRSSWAVVPTWLPRRRPLPGPPGVHRTRPWPGAADIHPAASTGNWSIRFWDSAAALPPLLAGVGGAGAGPEGERRTEVARGPPEAPEVAGAGAGAGAGVAAAAPAAAVVPVPEPAPVPVVASVGA